MEEAARQRQLEAADMFLETARSHLKMLSTGAGDGGKREGLPPVAPDLPDPAD